MQTSYESLGLHAVHGLCLSDGDMLALSLFDLLGSKSPKHSTKCSSVGQTHVVSASAKAAKPWLHLHGHAPMMIVMKQSRA